MICSMGKVIGMIPKCDDQNCHDPSHQKDKEDTKNKQDNENNE